MNLALSLGASALSLVFALIVYRQYVDRRRAYQLVWSVALLLFSVAAFCQFIAERNGWTPLIYRIWYATGAMLAAAYLGQGTIYLIAPRPVAHASLGALGFASGLGLGLVAALPVDLERAIVRGEITGNGFPLTLLLLLVPLNVYGTVALVGGAVASALRFRHHPGGGRRAVGTGLIAIGGLVVALGGTANRLGIPHLLYLSELLGMVVIFVGYLQTVTPLAGSAPERPPTTTSTETNQPSAAP